MGEKVQKFQADFYKFLPLLGFKGRNRARTGGLRVRGQGSGSTSREPSIGSGPPGTGREINPFLRVRHDRGCDESRTVNATVRATKSINPKDLGAFFALKGPNSSRGKGSASAANAQTPTQTVTPEVTSERFIGPSNTRAHDGRGRREEHHVGD